jgi:UDP-2,4-diacetamido-2,4,6-trideoxy-beta-L-altropyranose hydrolase
MRSPLFFRADGSTQIGLGHITRCMALADMLRADFHCIFLVQNPAPALKAQIEAEFEIRVLPESEDFLAEAHFLAKEVLKKGQIIVLDHYQIQTQYQKILKDAGLKVVCIDDMHAWHFVADVVINHAGGVSKEDYSCESYTKLCLGVEYALLRRPFLEAAQKLAAQGGRKIDRIERALICFGGADINNLTLQATQAAWESKKFKEIHIVTGSAFNFAQELLTFTKGKEGIFLHQNLDAQAMCDLMLHCELAIVPASGIAYEVAAVGMAFWFIAYAQNQRNIYSFLTQQAIGYPIETFSYLPQMLENMDFKNIETPLFFANSAKKNQKVFKSLYLNIRKATQKDIHTYFEWANESEVRKNSLNSDPITWENHCVWFQNKLQNPNSVLYIFSFGKSPVGQVRFDAISDQTFTIDYSVAKEHRGNGFGFLILKKSLDQLLLEKQVKILKAQVKSQNLASKAIFEKLNFILEREEKGEVLHFIKKY